MDAYNGNHLSLLETMARFTSTALQHARLYERTKEHAQADALTGLPNGRSFYARVEEEIAGASARGSSLRLLSLNITGMRAVNYTFGYQLGDRLLAEVAGLLKQAVGSDGMLGRLAGGEFICMLLGEDRDRAERLLARMQADIGNFALEARPGQNARVGFRSGMAEYPDDGQTADELLHAAAIAARPNEITRKHIETLTDPHELRLIPSYPSIKEAGPVTANR
jgi:diguanylate cyclase (GGDEF)-like protein